MIPAAHRPALRQANRNRRMGSFARRYPVRVESSGKVLIKGLTG